MSKTNGGPAFPIQGGAVSAGMTLRDYFAAEALKGMLSTGFMPQIEDVGPWDYVKASYVIADKMLVERAK